MSKTTRKMMDKERIIKTVAKCLLQYEKIWIEKYIQNDPEASREVIKRAMNDTEEIIKYIRENLK
ncbi:MAG: hypothetical protein R2685_11070 [Candidatus Nitrosocosmicus sp.]|nr:hypothetical protein [Candidatus Nitrosocosmicus sp.]